MPKGAKRRAADAAADASAKKGRRASEADVALRLGDELGEHTVVSLANIILLKIAADMEGDNIDRMAIVKNYLCLFVALLFVAKTFTETLITGSTSMAKTLRWRCGSGPDGRRFFTSGLERARACPRRPVVRCACRAREPGPWRPRNRRGRPAQSPTSVCTTS